MTFSKKFIIVAVVFLASIAVCKAHLHGDHHDHDIHHHDHGRLLKKPAKVNGAKPTKPTNGTNSTKLMTCGTKEPTTQEIAMVNNALKTISPGDVNPADIFIVPTWIHVITKRGIGSLLQYQINNQIAIEAMEYT
jgi:hypothetical protein